MHAWDKGSRNPRGLPRSPRASGPYVPQWPEGVRSDAPRRPQIEEDAITANYPWPPRYEPPASKVTNRWAPLSLGIALVALAYGSLVQIAETHMVRVAHNGAGHPTIAPVPGGSSLLQGRLFTSSWAALVLLLIAFAVAGGARSLALVRRDNAPGLEITVIGFVVCSVALVGENAIAAGLLGAIASFVVYRRYSGANTQAGGSPTKSRWFPAFHFRKNSAEAPDRPQGWARTVALAAFTSSVVGTILAALGAPSSATPEAHLLESLKFRTGFALSLVGIVLGIVALRRIRAKDEAGHDWAVAAITVPSACFGSAALLTLLWSLFLGPFWGGFSW